MIQLLETHYLSAARQQPGFIRSYLLEQIDDPNRAQLIQVWNSQADLEAFRQSGVSDKANRTLHQQIPGLQMQSQGYVVRVQPGDTLPPA
jgi:heme-degrading monooxygenase HmoA